MPKFKNLNVTFWVFLNNVIRIRILEVVIFGANIQICLILRHSHYHPIDLSFPFFKKRQMKFGSARKWQFGVCFSHVTNRFVLISPWTLCHPTGIMEMDQYPTLKRVVEDPLEDDDAEDDLLIQENRTLRRKKRQAPYLIFPEILCIIDYDGYRYYFLLLF